MDLSRYTFRASECASKLDEIEPKLGVKFDRKALFDREQSLVDQSRQGPRLMDVCWTFKVSKTGSGVHFFTSRGSDYEEVKECGCGNHIEFTSRELGYGTNALECALVDLDSSIPKIQALRQPKPARDKQMTTQDKETIMHESIARASLVAFAEFIEILTTERAKQTPPPPAKSEPIPHESECRAYVKRLNKELGINLNEDAVLAAGEVARATYKAGERPIMNYVLSVARASRVASFAVLDKDAATPSGVGLVVISTRYYPSSDGLQCALRTLSSPEKVSQVQSELTPVASISRQVSNIEGKLGSENQPPIFVFNGRETYNNGDHSAAFLSFLTSGAASLFLTFENRASRRVPATRAPRVHVHTSPTPFLPEFNTTISAPIDPANPAATLTALAERITAENL